MVALGALDHEKIKQFLRSAKDDRQTCALLQALRWRLVKSHRGESRQHVIQWLVNNDILGCTSPKEDALERLLRHSSRRYVDRRCIGSWSRRPSC